MMLGSERDGEVYDAVRTRTRSEPDAVLAATGHHYGLPVVTSDGSLLVACRELDVACLHVDELIAKLRN